MPPAKPKAFSRDQKEFSIGKLKLVLKYSANELRQRDAERLMGAIRRSSLGETPPEHAGKVLRAAVDAGWVVSPVLKVDQEMDDVGDMAPAETRWYAAQIDQVYAECMNTPLA